MNRLDFLVSAAAATAAPSNVDDPSFVLHVAVIDGNQHVYASVDVPLKLFDSTAIAKKIEPGSVFVGIRGSVALSPKFVLTGILEYLGPVGLHGQQRRLNSGNATWNLTPGQTLYDPPLGAQPMTMQRWKLRLERA